MNFTKKTRLSVLVAVALFLVIGLAACAAPQPETITVVETVVVEKEVEKEVEVTVEVEKIVEVEKEEEMLEPLPYGLKPGKPYDGSQIRFLTCCPTAAQFLGWEKSIPEFTDLTGIDVEFSWDPFGGFREKIVTESIAGTGSFDALMWVESWGPSLQNFLVPLAPRIEQDGIDLSDYPQATIEVSTYNGILYGLPTRTHVYLLFYRQDVLDELGLAVPQTWEELSEAARIIDEETDMSGISLHFAKQGTDQNLNTWINFVRANGSDWFDENWRPIFNNEAAVEATEYYLSLLDYAPPGASTFQENDARTAYLQGKAAMALLWSWSYETMVNPEAAIPEVIENTAFGAVPGPDGPAQSFGMTWPVGISAFSRNQDAAWEWIKWITSEGIEKQVITDKSDPATSTVVAARFSSLTDPEANEVNNGINQVMADALKTAHRRPIIPEWPEVIDIVGTAMTELAAGAPVQETLDKAAADVEEVLDRAGYYD